MPSKLLYRYGWLAWIWRVLITAFLFAAIICTALGLRDSAPSFLLIAAVLGAPALFFGATVVTQIERLDDGSLLVTNLLGTHRRISRERIGAPRRSDTYESESGTLYAPRCWIPIAGALPIYVDLLGQIPDRNALASALRLLPAAIPSRTRARSR